MPGAEWAPGLGVPYVASFLGATGNRTEQLEVEKQAWADGGGLHIWACGVISSRAEAVTGFPCGLSSTAPHI